jgi:hypothetical protein
MDKSKALRIEGHMKKYLKKLGIAKKNDNFKNMPPMFEEVDNYNKQD